ncbi:unnamed protein product [Arabidopsis arenosa]|uniref:SKP1-like protein n=1 Tax=Arabidopsis arenosa TaxID=38785 RepID=A0A8S2ADL6_ARAAE|nr:unnamed protein product [Arabidopsis arenosa]
MSSNMIVLTSSDGESFQVEEVVARKLQIVRHMLEDDCVINAIPLQNVTGKTLSMVLEYCKKHVDDVADDDVVPESTEGDGASDEPKKKVDDVVVPKSTEEDDASEEAKKKLDAWDAKFMKDLNIETIFIIILAANYLNVKGLLDLTSQTIADYIKDMTPEEVRELFNIENDFTPEEEEAIRKENAWTFEAASAQEVSKP